MPLPRDVTTRLAHLEDILAHTTSGTGLASHTNTDPAQVHLNSVPVERIRRLSAELEAGSASDLDAVDAVIMRLLLSEYTSAVAHLRAVAQMAASRVDHAGGPLREARRAQHRFEKTVASSSVNWLPPPDAGA